MNLEEIVKTAYEKAVQEDDSGSTEKEVNKSRSQNFVAYLAAEFRRMFEGTPGTYVLSKDHSALRSQFGMNELLYDVLVCEAEEVPSATKTTMLTCVSNGRIAVESEMAKDSRQALYDFNKLVLSSCDTQLFVGPLVSDIPAYLEPLAVAAKHCKGAVYLALIPHPGSWGPSNHDSTRFWKWNGRNWDEGNSEPKF